MKQPETANEIEAKTALLASKEVAFLFHAHARIHPNPLAQRQRSAKASLASRRYQPTPSTTVHGHQYQRTNNTDEQPHQRRDQRGKAVEDEGEIELGAGAAKLTAELCASPSDPCFMTANSAVGARELHNAVTLGWPNLLAVTVSAASVAASHRLPAAIRHRIRSTQALVQASKWRTGADVPKTDASRDSLKYARSETRLAREGCPGARGRLLVAVPRSHGLPHKQPGGVGGGARKHNDFYIARPIKISRGSGKKLRSTTFNIVCGV